MPLPQTVLDWLWHQLEFNYVELTRCYRECVEVLEAYGSLRPRTDVYTSEQGHSDLLVLIYGPLPVQIAGATYGIPIELWIPKQYPAGQPMCFVRPTAEMRISPGPVVDANGRVYIDFGSTGSLGEILAKISAEFSAHCPVYAVQRVPPQAPVQPPAALAAAPRPPTRPTTNIMDSEIPISSLSIESPLAEVVQATAGQLLKNEVEVDLGALESTKQVLDYLEGALACETAALEAAIGDAEASLKFLAEHTAAARAVIAKTHSPEFLVTSDDLVAARTPRSRELVEAAALDAALGDTLQVLAQAFSNERTDLGSFLRHTRQLARRQFVARAVVCGGGSGRP